MKKSSGLMMMSAFMFASLSSDYSYPNNSTQLRDIKKDLEVDRLKRQNKLKENKLKRGCSEFKFGDVIIIALNQKSAIKKAKKLGLI